MGIIPAMTKKSDHKTAADIPIVKQVPKGFIGLKEAAESEGCSKQNVHKKAVTGTRRAVYVVEGLVMYVEPERS